MEPLFELPAANESPKKDQGQGKARVQQANRQQMEMRIVSLDELLPADHQARLVWALVERMDLSRLYSAIRAVAGEAGRPAIDPRVLMAVWLYATIEGVGSARALDRLCQEHLAYQWLLGGVSVNYHSLADFRVDHEDVLDELLTQSVAALMKEGWVKLERTAQDGLKIRASAGGKSFRGRERLEQHLATAKARVADLKQQTHSAGEPVNRRSQAAQDRAAKERVERLERALEAMGQLEQKRKKAHNKRSQRKAPKCSSSDPDARIMKQFEGGFAPSHNGQLCVDTASRIIVGADVTTEADNGQMEPMLAQLETRYQRKPKDHLVDGGYVSFVQWEHAHQAGVTVYAPLQKPSKGNPDPTQPKAKDGPGVIAWRERMGTEAAKVIYKLRAATIEWANACLRNLGLRRVGVRGQTKVRAILLWFVLAHNFLRVTALRQASA